MEVENTENAQIPDADFFIDITDQVCPITFVKTKLLIESMPIGGVAEIRLQGAEALKNVPRSVQEQGHVILALAPENPDTAADTAHRLILRKT